VSVTGCSLGAAAESGYASISADFTTGLFTCGASGSTARIVARVSIAGAIDLSTTFSTSSSSYLPRGVASPDGVTIFAGDAHGIYRGTNGSSMCVVGRARGW
jgi:hypothetical protein